LTPEQPSSSDSPPTSPSAFGTDDQYNYLEESAKDTDFMPQFYTDDLFAPDAFNEDVNMENDFNSNNNNNNNNSNNTNMTTIPDTVSNNDVTNYLREHPTATREEAFAFFVAHAASQATTILAQRVQIDQLNVLVSQMKSMLISNSMPHM